MNRRETEEGKSQGKKKNGSCKEQNENKRSPEQERRMEKV